MGDGVHLDSGWESLHRSLPQGTLAPGSLLPSILLWLWLLRGQNTIRKMRLSTAYGGAGCECGGRGDWLYQRQECHRRGAPVWWTTTQLQRGTLLGAGVCGVHGGL